MKNIVLLSQLNILVQSASKITLGKALIILLFVMIMYPMTSSAQVCDLTLTAKNNIESVNSDGRIYFMVLQNNTAEEIDVSFTASNNNAGLNPDASNGSNNVNLDAAVRDKNGLAISGSVHLASNETLEFQVKMTVPSNTALNHWNNTKVVASSDKCTNYSTSLNLFTFIPIPE